MNKPPPIPDAALIKRAAINEIVNTVYTLAVERKQIELFEKELDDMEWPISIRVEFGNKIIESEAIIDRLLNDFNIRQSPEYTYTQNQIKE